MGKAGEVAYIDTVTRVDNVRREDFVRYLAEKPFSDGDAAGYLEDVAQMLGLLPPKPARILDLGTGSGWTSEFYARCGYEVVGLDISPEMIEIARHRIAPGLELSFAVSDYEEPASCGLFDAVTVYDALHHAIDESLAIRQAYDALKPGGWFLCLEPGRGHSQTEESVSVMKKYGTTEKDMPYDHVRELLERQGFSNVEQFLRVRQMPRVDLARPVGGFEQIQHFVGLIYETTRNGLTSLVRAKKP